MRIHKMQPRTISYLREIAVRRYDTSASTDPDWGTHPGDPSAQELEAGDISAGRRGASQLLVNINHLHSAVLQNNLMLALKEFKAVIEAWADTVAGYMPGTVELERFSGSEQTELTQYAQRAVQGARNLASSLRAFEPDVSNLRPEVGYEEEQSFLHNAAERFLFDFAQQEPYRAMLMNTRGAVTDVFESLSIAWNYVMSMLASAYRGNPYWSAGRTVSEAVTRIYQELRALRWRSESRSIQTHKRQLREWLDPASLAVGALAAGPVLGAVGYVAGRAGQAALHKVRTVFEPSEVDGVLRVLKTFFERFDYDTVLKLLSGKPISLAGKLLRPVVGGLAHPALSAPIGARLGSDESVLRQAVQYRDRKPELFKAALQVWADGPASNSYQSMVQRYLQDPANFNNPASDPPRTRIYTKAYWKAWHSKKESKVPALQRKLQEFFDPTSAAVGAVAAGPVIAAAGYGIGRAAKAVVSRLRRVFDRQETETIERLIASEFPNMSWSEVHNILTQHEHFAGEVVRAVKAGVVHPFAAPFTGIARGSQEGGWVLLRKYRASHPREFFRALTNWLGRSEARAVVYYDSLRELLNELIDVELRMK